MLRSKRMKLIVFIASSTLNLLAVIGVVIAITAPIETEFDTSTSDTFDA